MDRPPRFRSAAAVAGTGAGGSLGAAAICILVLVTATVTYVPRGTPPVREPTATARLADPASPSPREPRSSPPAARRAPLARRAAADRGARRRSRPLWPRPQPALVTAQRGARPVLTPAPTVAPPAPAPPEPAPPQQPTLVRGHVEAVASQVRETGSGTPAQPVTERAASTVEGVARLLP